MVWKAIEAGEQLAELGIDAEIINIHTIKPLDKSAVLQSIKKTRCAVTAEEHQLNGGLGDAISHVLSKNYPAPVEFVAVNDTFGESGTPDQLLEKYGLTASNIVNAVKKVLQRKKVNNGIHI
jgi:transketolase